MYRPLVIYNLFPCWLIFSLEGCDTVLGDPILMVSVNRPYYTGVLNTLTSRYIMRELFYTVKELVTQVKDEYLGQWIPEIAPLRHRMYDVRMISWSLYCDKTSCSFNYCKLLQLSDLFCSCCCHLSFHLLLSNCLQTVFTLTTGINWKFSCCKKIFISNWKSFFKITIIIVIDLACIYFHLFWCLQMSWGVMKQGCAS